MLGRSLMLLRRCRLTASDIQVKIKFSLLSAKVCTPRIELINPNHLAGSNISTISYTQLHLTPAPTGTYSLKYVPAHQDHELQILLFVVLYLVS